MAQQSNSPAPVSSHDRILAAAKRLFATRGYESTSTVAIARLAGTSESQLTKHFGSKEGLLEAIFERGWQAMSGRLHALQGVPEPVARLRSTMELIVQALDNDPEMRELMLLEGRRVRREGNAVLMTAGYLQLVSFIDQTVAELKAAGQLRAELHPQAIRSALIGMFEGLMRDHLLAERAGYPASFTRREFTAIFDAAISAFVVAQRGESST
ncbi:MAG TPA: TetR/AcrR family transcriptional regulator [Terriglobales bacterium]|nr:TetR/AcrR family transcriptional regulator [Terriglobales bacterium]